MQVILFLVLKHRNRVKGNERCGFARGQVIFKKCEIHERNYPKFTENAPIVPIDVLCTT